MRTGTKKIYFITSAPIIYMIGSLDVYDSFDCVSMGKLDAPLVQNAAELVDQQNFPFDSAEIKMIFTAPHGQTLVTGELIQNRFTESILLSTPLLESIRFTMDSLISKEEFLKHPLNKALNFARRNFVSLMFYSRLNEKLAELELRLDACLDLFKTTDSSLVIGHSYFLKILQIHLNKRISLQTEDEFMENFKPDKKPFEPLSGFTHEY